MINFLPIYPPSFFVGEIYKKGGNGGEGERGRREDLFVQFAKGKEKERDLNSPAKKGKKRRRGEGSAV